MINEFLYTEESNYAFKHFQQNRGDFMIYHEGFSEQVKTWKTSPVALISQMVTSREEIGSLVVADLGCGTGELYKHIHKTEGLPKEILSYDLISTEPYITVADMKQLPLDKESVDIAVFCLALMGTNYIDFLIEATRVLKIGGSLIIAEVTSRLPNLDMFLLMMTYLGYSLVHKVTPNQFFLVLELTKDKPKTLLKAKAFEYNSAILRACTDKARKINKKQMKKTAFQLGNLDQLSKYVLKPCIYKRR